MIKYLKSLTAVGFALAVALAASASIDAASSAGAAEQTVTIDNFTFNPSALTVRPGATVTWINQDDIPHTIASTTRAFRSKALDTDDRFSFTFATPGVYEYFCSLHPHMKGTIIVREGAGKINRCARPEESGARRNAGTRRCGWSRTKMRTPRRRASAQWPCPYVDDVYSLARYLLGNTADAEDAAQEAFLRAFRHFDTFRGVAIKPWLFAILRNVCWSIRKSSARFAAPLDDDDDRAAPLWSAEGETPEAEVLRQRDSTEVRRLLDELPVAFREVVVLREIDDLSYREIAEIVGVPVGTIMSRLARGRAMLRAAWLAGECGEKAP